jgi:hypothetical protein
MLATSYKPEDAEKAQEQVDKLNGIFSGVYEFKAQPNEATDTQSARISITIARTAPGTPKPEAVIPDKERSSSSVLHA